MRFTHSEAKVSSTAWQSTICPVQKQKNLKTWFNYNVDNFFPPFCFPPLSPPKHGHTFIVVEWNNAQLFIIN